MSEKVYVGTILSGSTTSEAACQLLEAAERGGIREGMLLLIESGKREILARVAQIIPYNAFYTEGDPFSEARRKGMEIPEEVARRYEICKLDLLMQINPREDIKQPPQPGDRVLRIDPTIHEKEIFGVSRGESKHVWMGSLSGYEGAPIPLNVDNIPMHMAIFGVTGSGKSFDTGVLIEKLASIPWKKDSISYPMIIIDAHGDYVDYIDHVKDGNKLGHIGWIKRYVFPSAYVRPEMRKASKVIQPIGINLDLLPHRELAEIIILFYKGTTEGADLQINGIEALFERMKAKGFTSIHDIFLHNYRDLLNELEAMAEEIDMHSSTQGAISRALNNFMNVETRHSLLSAKSDLRDVKKSDGDIEEVKFVDNITKDGGIMIFDFSADGAPGIDLATKQLVMTYLASVLFNQFTKFKIKEKEDRYLLFVIEEAQNFAPDKSFPIGASLAHDKLSAIATQGRKFGLSLCLISQRPSFVDQIVLSMCNSFFIHRMSPGDVSYVKSVSGLLPPSLIPRLTKLDKGEMIVTGQIATVDFPLVVTIPKGDRKIPHTVGQTKVVESLARLRGIT